MFKALEKNQKAKRATSVRLLAIGLGIIFIWFGLLKLIPGFSAAEAIASKAIASFSFGIFTPPYSTLFLGYFEILIGIGILTNRYKSTAIWTMYFHLSATIISMFLFPEEAFIVFGLVPTLLGQYILKNIIFILCGIVIQQENAKEIST